MGTRTSRTAPKPETNVEKLIGSWNANASKIDAIMCDGVDIDGTTQGKPITINAKLAYQRDKRFRMTGTFNRMAEVDLGSNEKEIWFWLRRAEPPSLYHCDRSELAHVRLTTPFHPDWIIDVLGVTPLDPRDYRLGPSNPELLSLVALQTTPSGQPITKRLVVDPRTNRISAFELFDADNKKLLEATILDYHDDAAINAYVPRRVRFEWPEERTKLTLGLRSAKIKLNAIPSNIASDVFRLDKRNYVNTEIVDLAAASRAARGGDSPADRAVGTTVNQSFQSREEGAGIRLTGRLEAAEAPPTVPETR